MNRKYLGQLVPVLADELRVRKQRGVLRFLPTLFRFFRAVDGILFSGNEHRIDLSIEIGFRCLHFIFTMLNLLDRSDRAGNLLFDPLLFFRIEIEIETSAHVRCRVRTQ